MPKWLGRPLGRSVLAMAGTASGVSKDAVLRHRLARLADGAPRSTAPSVQVRTGNEDVDFVVIRPPQPPAKGVGAVFAPLVSALWRVKAFAHSVTVASMLEPSEIIIMGRCRMLTQRSCTSR